MSSFFDLTRSWLGLFRLVMFFGGGSGGGGGGRGSSFFHRNPFFKYLDNDPYSQEHYHGTFTAVNVNKTVLDSG